MKLKGIIILLFLILLIQSFPLNDAEENQFTAAQLRSDDKYYLQIIVSQWKYSIFNLEENMTIQDNVDSGKEIAISGEDSFVGPFLTGKSIIFELYSRDVQHGFSIDELNIAVSVARPPNGKTLGEATIVEAILPNSATTFSIYCQIFCGLGHKDLNIDFIVVDNLADFTISNSSDNETLEVLSFGLLPFSLGIGIIILIRRKLNQYRIE